MKRAVVPALFGLNALIGYLALRQQYSLDRPWTFLVSDFASGAAMAVAAALVWRRRPQNRCWWLLLAASFASWIGDFEHVINRDISLFAFAGSRWYDLFLPWAVLAYPSGRLPGRPERLLVVTFATLAGARTLSRLFLFVPADVAGYGTRNRFLPIDDDRWWRLVENWHGRGLIVATVVVLVLLGARWLRSSRTSRQMLSPTLFAGSAFAVAVFYEFEIGWNSRVGAVGDVRIYYVVWWLRGALALALSIGMVRLRRTRSAVVDVFSELGHDAPPSRLQEALGRALGDPSLILVPWSSASLSYTDGNGTTVDVAGVDPLRAVTLIEREGEPLAALVHDAALLEDPGLVNAVVAAVRLTIDNDQLQVELEKRLAEVAASRTRIVEAGDAERRRLERNLHDGAQQRLVSTALNLKLAGARLADTSDPRVHDVLDEAAKELSEAISELRDLARGIHPSILTEFGLGAALEGLANRFTLPVEVDIDLPPDLPDIVAATAYFTVSEALTNVMKHADAHRVVIRARIVERMINIQVIDDGKGGADACRGSGLAGIADRVATVGGTVQVVSPPGRGTRFEIELPCGSL